MGKVHRIKKQFWKVMSQTPPPEGYTWIGNGIQVYTGIRPDGSRYLSVTSSGNSYRALQYQLMREYNAQRVAHSDNGPVKG